MQATGTGELLTIAGMKAELCEAPTRFVRTTAPGKWRGLIEAIKSLPDGSALRLYSDNPKSLASRLGQVFSTGSARRWRDQYKRKIHVHKCEGGIVVWHSAAKEPPHATES